MISYSASEIWLDNLRHIITRGIEVSPRGIKSFELLSFQSTFDMAQPVVTVPGRKIGYKFMAAEAAWILSGDNKVSTITRYSKDMAKFSDDGCTFFGAYGPRVVDQISRVAKVLAKDPDTRQAVMTLWRPNPPETKDVPCTVAIQWFIRDGKLHCIDVMRSSDIWLGWPYDVFSFTMVSLAISIILRNSYDVKVELGNLTLFAGSQHLYEKNLEAAKAIIKSPGTLPPSREFALRDYGDVEGLIDALWGMAEHAAGVYI